MRKDAEGNLICQLCKMPRQGQMATSSMNKGFRSWKMVLVGYVNDGPEPRNTARSLQRKPNHTPVVRGKLSFSKVSFVSWM